MIPEETNSSRLEALRMAKEIVDNEYVNRRAEIHNRWLEESAQLWALQRLKLPYPSIPPYPSEDEVIRVAQSLLTFNEDDHITKTKQVRNALVMLPTQSNS